MSCLLSQSHRQQKFRSMFFFLLGKRRHSAYRSKKRSAQSKNIAAFYSVKAGKRTKADFIHAKGFGKAPMEENISFMPSISPFISGNRKMQTTSRKLIDIVQIRKEILPWRSS